jgi:hypothetical protein
MPKDRWLSLDDKTRAIWLSIDDKFKNIILGYTSSTPSNPSISTHSGKTPSKFSTKPPFKSRKAYLHDQAFSNKLEDVQEESADDTPKSADLEPDPPADLLINAAKGTSSTSLLTGDIRRVMSKNLKCTVNTAFIEYKVSYHKEHHGISPLLIDRGANGGVAGSDVHVIFKTNSSVDIQACWGIDNHYCTNI